MAASHQPRVVAVLSFALEANVFNPVPRRLQDFQRLEGERYASCVRHAGFAAVLRRESPLLFQGVQLRFVALFRGFTGGLVPSEDFEEMRQAAIAGLEALGPCAGVFLDLHGAMGVADRGATGDAEAELAESLRTVVGPECLVTASFDLHGNVSERLLRSLDAITAYRTMPHIDMEESKRKGLRMLLSLLQTGGPRPTMAFVSVPVCASGDTVLTTEGKGRELYARLEQVESQSGVLDASIFVGHQHANEARVRAAVVLTGLPAARAQLAQAAQSLAQLYWDSRAGFAYPQGCPLLPWDECLEQAVSAAVSGRVVLGDFGDNVCAGATGDVPFVLRQLLQNPGNFASALVAGLVDPVAVEHCCAVGRGGTLPTLTVGARLTTREGVPDNHYGEMARPLQLTNVSVQAIVNMGPSSKPSTWAIVQSGSVSVLLQDKVWGFFSQRDFEVLPEDLQPQNFQLLVLKMGINLEELARELDAPRCFLANTPGATKEPLPDRAHLQRPLWISSEDVFNWEPAAVFV